MLWDNPPHSIALYSVTSGADTGAGVLPTYTVAQSGIPCSINTTSASTQTLYAQSNIVVSHTIAILASVLTAVPVPGWKAQTTDRSESYHILGIRHGRAYGNVPAFVYLDCDQIL